MLIKGQALIIVDVQVDFCKGGALEAHNTETLFKPLNLLIKTAEKKDIPIIMTRDFHPSNHMSFKSNGGVWAPHCVQNTKGVELVSELYIPNTFILVNKGKHSHKEAYSGFEGTGLKTMLNNLGVNEVFIAGIALEYCIRKTAQDALLFGFKVNVLQDCVRSVSKSTKTQNTFYKQLTLQGIKIIDSSEV